MTFYQLIKKKYFRLKKKCKVKALENNPQKKGICIKANITMAPRKPNSAKRQVVKVRLCNGYYLVVFVPGEQHNTLKIHSSVMIEGRGCRDLPGINYHAIRGLCDLQSIPDRRKSRSKYGTKLYKTKQKIK